MSDQRLRELDRAARHDPAAAARLDVELVEALRALGHDIEETTQDGERFYRIH